MLIFCDFPFIEFIGLQNASNNMNPVISFIIRLCATYNLIQQMPRVYKPSVPRQKHKPFKGSKKKKNEGDFKTGGTVFRKKKIKKRQAKKESKVRASTKKARPIMKKKEEQELQQLEKKLQVNSYLDANTKTKIEQLIKTEVGVKIVVLIPLNEDADASAVKNSIQQYIHSKNQTMGEQIRPQPNANTFNYPYFTFFAHPKNFPGLVKENFTFIQADRNIQSALDLCKVADIICPVLSVKSVNAQALALDPTKANAFDDHGYLFMNVLKRQGIPCTISIIQHLQTIQPKNQQKVEKIFRRYFTSEFGEEDRVVTLSNSPDSIFYFLRMLQTGHPKIMTWRDNRGYLLAESVTYDGMTKSLEVSGFLKGNCINANQIAHITGIDDFEVQKIEIVKSKSKLMRVKSKPTIEQQLNLTQHCTTNDDIFPFHKSNEKQVDAQDLAGAFEGLTLSKPLLQQQQEGGMEEQKQGDQDQSISFDDDEFKKQDKQNEKKQRVEMQMRTEDEMEFEDEVDYQADVPLREKFSEYRGLTSFRKTDWNPLENLPDQYNRIYVFKDYQKTYKNAVFENKEKGFAYPGFYVKVTLKNVPIELLQKHGKSAPLILSFLFKHQRKMTLVHLRVKRNEYYPSMETPVESNRSHLISFGFRRFFATPIFSKCFNGCDKTKFRNSFVDYEHYYYCSFYYYNTFPPAPVSICRIGDTGQPQQMPIMYGQLAKPDPMHVILQRVILTGYPFKINKRRATVRYMFFDPKDIRYFRPVELITKLGLRGNIEQSLGTHGLMKCFFSDRIKPHDTICLHLYKRVFPKAPF